jgi:hypothetical protein
VVHAGEAKDVIWLAEANVEPHSATAGNEQLRNSRRNASSTGDRVQVRNVQLAGTRRVQQSRRNL